MDLWSDDLNVYGDELQELLRASQVSNGETEASETDSSSLSAGDYVKLMRETLAATPFPLDEHVKETKINDIPCRVMTPKGKTQAIYLHFHGGGMVAGSAFMSDEENRHLSDNFNLAVISVDYRLAPEFPFPAAADDSFAVASWLLENSVAEFGTDKLLIGGESAGAYLAALTLLRIKNSLGPSSVDRFLGANLIFGVFDWSHSPSQLGKRPNNNDFDVLSPEIIKFLCSLYLPSMSVEDRQNPSVSPIYADLQDLTPAYFCVGSSDHLLDDTLMLANRWRAAGNSCRMDIFPRAPHAFTMFPSPFVDIFSKCRDDWFSKILNIQ